MIPTAATRALIRSVPTFGGKVLLPGSKSLTNRALLIAALASGRSRLVNVLDCDDSQYLRRALAELGVQIEIEDTPPFYPPIWAVTGTGGKFPVREGSFFLGNAGTATRFLTAALTAAEGRYSVDGDHRMRERPIGDLVTALEDLGAEVRAPTGCPPVQIGARPLRGGTVHISGSTSSQYISAILMVSPLATRAVDVLIEGELVSGPYIDLTLRTMNDFGARAWLDSGRADGRPQYHVVPGRDYRAREYFVEGDASAASYFFAGAAITGGTVRVDGVGKESPQGDVRCADVLAEMGCRVKKEPDAITVSGPATFLNGVDVDCGDMPDVVPTLAVVAAFARGRTRLRGVPHLRFKESDRIASVASELTKIGGDVRELRDGLEVVGSLGRDDHQLHGATIDTWGDHRIAMAFSIVGLVVPDVVIADPGVVSKSFPEFFGVLRGLGARVTIETASGERIDVDAYGGAGER